MFCLLRLYTYFMIHYNYSTLYIISCIAATKKPISVTSLVWMFEYAL